MSVRITASEEVTDSDDFEESVFSRSVLVLSDEVACDEESVAVLFAFVLRVTVVVVVTLTHPARAILIQTDKRIAVIRFIVYLSP